MQVELGAAPSPETEALYRALTTHAAVCDPPRQVAATIPLVGRERACSLLAQRIERLTIGHGGVLAITGEPGIGKTRLLEETRSLTQGGASQLNRVDVRCFEPDSQLSFALWEEWLLAFAEPPWQSVVAQLSPVWRAELARFVPQLAPPGHAAVDLARDESRLRLRQAVVQLLRLAVRDRPLVIVIDDLHWADEESIALLAYAIRQCAKLPVFYLMAWRAVDAAHATAFSRFADSLSSVDVLALDPLDADAAKVLARAVAGDVADDERGHDVVASGGNPFVLIETLRHRSLAGHAAGRPSPTDGIHGLVRSRIAHLPEPARALAHAYAIIGRPATLATAAAVLGRDASDLASALPGLQAADVLREVEGAAGGPLLGFRHDWLRVAVHASVPQPERVALHRRLADMLAGTTPRRNLSHLDEAARHLELADDPRAVDALQFAAEAAVRGHAPTHAVRLYERALARIAPVEPAARARRFELLGRCEAIHGHLGQRTAQAAAASAMMVEADALDDDALRAIVWVRKAGVLAYRGLHGESGAAGHQALGLFRQLGDGVGEARALRELAFMHWAAGDYGTALDCGRQALEQARRRCDAAGEASALHNLAEIHRSLGSPHRALDLYGAALRLQWALDQRDGRVLTLFGMAHAQTATGDRAAARRSYREALAASAAIDDLLMASRAHQALALLARADGDLDGALQAIDRALGLGRQIAYAQGLAHDLLELARIQRLRGVDGAAIEALREAADWFAILEDDDGVRFARARMARAITGDPDDAFDHTRPAWETSHVDLPEGKMYCAFESPLARQGRDRPSAYLSNGGSSSSFIASTAAR